MHYWLKLKALVRAPLLVCLWVPCSPSFIAARSHGWVFPVTDQYVWVSCGFFLFIFWGFQVMLLYQCPADGLHTVDQMIIMMVARLRTLQLAALMVVHSLVIPTALPSILNLDCNAKASPSCIFALFITWFHIPSAPGWGHHLYTVAVEEQGNIQTLGSPSSGSCPTRVSPRLGTCSWTDRS